MTQRLIDLLNIGGICPKCDKPHAQCVCGKQPTDPTRPKTDGIVRVGRETAGRRGKGVTTISGLPLDQEGMLELAGQLKSRCGSGGTVKDWRIEIQGDHRDTVIGQLKELGYQVKRTGG